jgi:hypothetical protein
MTARSGLEDESAELDRLRRRLYRPGADAEDVRRYEAARAAAAPPAAPGPAAAGADRRGRPVWIVLLGGAALLLIGTSAAVVRAQTADEGRGTFGTPTPVPSAAVAELRAVPPVTAVRIPPVTAEFHGRGAGTAWLDSAALPASSGRLDLVLTLAETARVRWWVTRIEIGRDGASIVRIIAEQTWTQTSGVAVPFAFPYRGAPPTAVRIEVPDGVAWSLVVSAAD